MHRSGLDTPPGDRARPGPPRSRSRAVAAILLFLLVLAGTWAGARGPDAAPDLRADLAPAAVVDLAADGPDAVLPLRSRLPDLRTSTSRSSPLRLTFLPLSLALLALGARGLVGPFGQGRWCGHGLLPGWLPDRRGPPARAGS